MHGQFRRKGDIATMDHDIVIAGGGLNGLTMGLALARAGFSVALADADPQRDRPGDPRAYALAEASVNLLRNLGLWESLAPLAQPINQVVVQDGAGPELIFGADQPGDAQGVMIEQGDLRPALLAGLAGAGVQPHFGQRLRLVETTPQVSVVELAGQRLTASLVIAADGRSSELASAAGIKRQSWRYGQTAIVMTLEHETPHQGLARQIFLPGGPLALLPLNGNRSCIVWTTEANGAKSLLALESDGLMTAFSASSHGVLGAAKLIAGPASFDLQLSLADSFVSQRLALIGDAAHVVHPLAGQGLNAGLKDVAALCDVLTSARRRGEDIGAPGVLARYESWRRFDVAQLAMTTDVINRSFSNANGLMRSGRGLALRALGNLPGLRGLLGREARGLTGDLPALMRSDQPSP